MQRIVQKFSIVYVSVAEKTEVFRSMEEIPADVRERLLRIARKSQVETLIIANERGRELLGGQGGAEGMRRSQPLSAAWKWTIVATVSGLLAALVVVAFQYR